jgi:parvulin-like peptidyl-prolyl isomerase
MGIVFQVGEQLVKDEDLFPLLAKYGMLPQLAREIIIEKAIAAIDCTPEEVAAAKQRFLQQNQIASEVQLQNWLEQYGMTPEQMEQISLRDLKLEKYKQQTWGNKLEAYFLQCKGQLDRVVYSLIRTRDSGIAQELYFRIQEQESSFAQLAKEYSQGAEAQTGGLVGPVELSVPHPQIAKILGASKPGQLWPPVQIGEWTVILRLEKYLAAQLDAPTEQRLLNDLFQGWLMGQMHQQINFQPNLESPAL